MSLLEKIVLTSMLSCFILTAIIFILEALSTGDDSKFEFIGPVSILLWAFSLVSTLVGSYFWIWS